MAKEVGTTQGGFPGRTEGLGTAVCAHILAHGRSKRQEQRDKASLRAPCAK